MRGEAKLHAIAREVSPRRVLRPALAVSVIVTMALCVSGCWIAALQLAPTAIQAVEAVGSGVANMAAGTAMAHQASKMEKEGQPPQDSDVCDELSLEVPMLVELRTDAQGVTRYRELSLVGGDLDPEWAAMPNQDLKDGGWKVASNFTRMNFRPPLKEELTANSVSYIAYAAADARDATEQDQLNALEIGFGPAMGTFTWNQRSFRYALVHKLPCFPPPSEPKS